MKKTIYLFLCLLAFACNQTSKPIGDPEATDAISAKIDSTSDTEKSSNINKGENQLSTLIKDFPKKWQHISNENEEFIFFYPCDAELSTIEIKAGANGTYKLHYLSGQEGETFELVAMRKWEEPFADEVETYYELEFKSGDQTHQAKVNFSSPELAGWSGFFGTPRPMLFAPESHFNYYPEVHSPCTECFEEEECQKEQDWGIGLIQPIFEETIKLYNFKGATEHAKEIKFSNKMVSNYDELRAWSSFESYYPEYDIFYIRCLEEQDGWYKIMGNKLLERVMWVKKSPKLKFLTWEEYLKATLSVTVLDPQTNPFRTEKGGGKLIESSCTGGYQVVSIDGMYAKVKQNELTTECESGKPLETEGWIQWRNANKQLVRIAWVM